LSPSFGFPFRSMAYAAKARSTNLASPTAGR
jgi:hypothetical protein